MFGDESDAVAAVHHEKFRIPHMNNLPRYFYALKNPGLRVKKHERGRALPGNGKQIRRGRLLHGEGRAINTNFVHLDSVSHIVPSGQRQPRTRIKASS